MDLRQTAVITPNYHLDRAPKLTPSHRRQSGSEAQFADVHAAPGPAAGRGWTKRSSGLVGGGWPTAKTDFAGAEPARGFRPTGGATRAGGRNMVGLHHVPAFFSLRLRVAQRSKHRFAAEHEQRFILQLNRMVRWRVGAQAGTSHGNSSKTSSRCAGPPYRIGWLASNE